jgi:hypothetical protein
MSVVSTITMNDGKSRSGVSPYERQYIIPTNHRALTIIPTDATRDRSSLGFIAVLSFIFTYFPLNLIAAGMVARHLEWRTQATLFRPPKSGSRPGSGSHGSCHRWVRSGFTPNRIRDAGAHRSIKVQIVERYLVRAPYYWPPPCSDTSVRYFPLRPISSGQDMRHPCCIFNTVPKRLFCAHGLQWTKPAGAFVD